MEKTAIAACLWGYCVFYICACICKLLGHTGRLFGFFVLAMTMFLIVAALIHALSGMAERRGANLVNDGPIIEHGVW